VQTAYTWRTPQWSPFNAPLTIQWASGRTNPSVEQIVRRVSAHIKAFVWGIKTTSLNGAVGADLEFYFYGYDWSVVYEALDAAVGCNVRELTVPFKPMMISANVPLTGEVIEEVDVYDGPTSSCHVQHSNGTHDYKNHYWLDFVKTKGANTSDTVSKQLEWVGNMSRRFLVFDEWEFGLAVARKTRSRKGVYFSGVAVDRARSLVPAVLKKVLRAAPASALVDVAYDVVGEEIINTCVYSGLIVEPYRMIKHVMADGMDVRIVQDFVASNKLADLRAMYTPNRTNPKEYPLSFAAVGEYRAALWNTIPADECYHHHGVLVRDQTWIEGDARLWQFEWLKKHVARMMGPVRLLEVRSKAHVRRSNGVWLHTDSQREHLNWLEVDAEPGLTRDLLVLVYLTSLRDYDGGKLHVFANTSRHPNAERIYEYQSNVPISFSGPITTDKVGGEWLHGLNTFHPMLELIPTAGTMVMLDNRKVDNVHAVTQMHTGTRRELLEAWFSVVSLSDG